MGNERKGQREGSRAETDGGKTAGMKESRGSRTENMGGRMGRKGGERKG